MELETAENERLLEKVYYYRHLVAESNADLNNSKKYSQDEITDIFGDVPLVIGAKWNAGYFFLSQSDLSSLRLVRQVPLYPSWGEKALSQLLGGNNDLNLLLSGFKHIDVQGVACVINYPRLTAFWKSEFAATIARKFGYRMDPISSPSSQTAKAWCRWLTDFDELRRLRLKATTSLSGTLPGASGEDIF